MLTGSHLCHVKYGDVPPYRIGPSAIQDLTANGLVNNRRWGKRQRPILSSSLPASKMAFFLCSLQWERLDWIGANTGLLTDPSHIQKYTLVSMDGAERSHIGKVITFFCMATNGAGSTFLFRLRSLQLTFQRSFECPGTGIRRCPRHSRSN